MKQRRTLKLAVAAGTLFVAGGCIRSTKTAARIEDAGNATDRYVSAVETADQWWDLSAAAARLLMAEYGVPDEVYPDRLVWNDKGPWRRSVVRNANPAAQEGADLGIIAQTVVYPLTPPQAAVLAAFDNRLDFSTRDRELFVRSDREEFNRLRLNLADDVVHGRLSPGRARETYFEIVALQESGKTSPDLLRLRLTP